ncbi:hypothetical protein CF70_017105 [Cupriavidus sp. SK-3]|nr:hypothetical protein CF70_017105 [Cupriavidus sp. SK-3]
MREIARRLGISRNTVRRYLRPDVTAPAYPTRQSPSKLDGHAAKLATWLKTEANKPRKQRRTLKQIHMDLCALGFTGSYDRVAAFARRWRQEPQEQARSASRSTFIPLRFAEGEAFQFDWSEDWAVIAGERTKLQVAQFNLSHSRAFFLRAYPLQTHEMLFDAHHHTFVAWGGIPRRGIYANIKTAVDRVRRGKLRDVNARFSTMVSHYLFDAEFRSMVMQRLGADCHFYLVCGTQALKRAAGEAGCSGRIPLSTDGWIWIALMIALSLG